MSDVNEQQEKVNKQRGMTVKGLGILLLIVEALAIISLGFQSKGIIDSITAEHLILAFFKIVLLGITAIFDVFLALFALWVTFDTNQVQ